MAASILLLNPNRHRASEKLNKSANRNPAENNMRRTPKPTATAKAETQRRENKERTLTLATCS
jgi:hypothetical protein